MLIQAKKQTILEMIEGRRSIRQHELEEMGAVTRVSKRKHAKFNAVAKAAIGELELNKLCVPVGKYPSWRVDLLVDFNEPLEDDTVVVIRATNIADGSTLDFSEVFGEFPSEQLTAQITLLAG